jgi:gliding motility-associated-like protein
VWQDGSNNQTYTATQGGLYWVEVINQFNCSSRDSVNLFFSASPPTPVLSSNGQVLDFLNTCTGNNLLFEVDVTGGSEYYWIVNGDTISGDFPSTLFENLDTMQTGMYYAYYVDNGCPSFADSVNVTVNLSPEFDFGFSDSTICEGSSLTLDASTSEDVEFLWQDNSTNSEYSVTQSGLYWLEIETPQGCSVIDSVQINVLPFPQLPEISGDFTLCGDDSLVLTGNDEPGVSYNWVTPSGQISGNTLTLSDPVVGTYYLTATIDRCVSPVIDSVIVQLFSLPQFDLGPDQALCNGSTIILEGPANMSSYSWSTNDTSQSIIATVGSYVLSVTDANGCAFEDAIVFSSSGPLANFNSDPEGGTQTGVNVQFIDASTGSPVSWLWNFGDNTNATSQNAAHTYATEGTLNVSLIATDAAGCSDTVSRVFVVSNSLKIPNSFTPNGDGFNDFFTISGLAAFPNSNLQIFNRWGTEIYQSGDYQNNWDGTNYPEGVYFYVLNTSEKTYSGDVTLKRE